MSESEKEVDKPTNAPTTTPRARGLFWNNIGILFSAFAIIVILVSIAMTSYGLIAANACLAKAFKFMVSEFTQSQAEVMTAQKSMTDLQQTVQQNSNTLKNQTQSITDLQKSQRTNKEDFLAAEALFLVKLANDHLQFENNVAVAIKLLQSADQDLTSLTDPRINPVREALATDLAALQRTPQVDVSGIYVRLSILSNEVDKLPVVNAFTSSKNIAFEKTDETLSWWRRGLNSMSQALQHMVIIRNNQPNIPPFITPDQQAFLYQNLMATFEKAEWGLLHRQQVVYQSSLQQAIDWIKRYIVQDSPMTKQVLANLQELQKMNVQPSVPNVTNSQQALRTYLNK